MKTKHDHDLSFCTVDQPNTYRVELPTTDNFGARAIVRDQRVIVHDGILYVMANNAEEVGRLFPDALCIQCAGPGYVEVRENP